MRALSLKQPFAELILQGRKAIEIRKWNTKFRGKFLIHSSKIPDEKAMKHFGFTNLPDGFVLGKAKLVDVKKYNSKKEFEKDKNKHLASRKFGNFGFILTDIQRIKPVPAKGSLNFWDFDIK